MSATISADKPGTSILVVENWPFRDHVVFTRKPDAVATLMA